MAIQLATLDELQAWVGPVDATLAGLILNGVSATAIRLASGSSSGWTSSVTVPDEVKTIVLQVAARVAANPSSLGSETVAGYSFTKDSRQPGGVVFTADERQALLEAAGIDVPTVGRALSVTFSC